MSVMTERRRKQIAASVIESLSKTHSENFITEFLTNCENHCVNPLPTFSVVDNLSELHYPVSHVHLTSKSAGDLSEISDRPYSQIRVDKNMESPLIFMTFENPVSLANPRKLHCKGYEISIFCLDALNATLPFYWTITELKLQNCQINAYGIELIAEMLKKIKCIRDLNLDMNPNLRQNYYLLCSSAGKLQFLSLKLCEISDESVKRISEELKFRDPPDDPKLICLNLTNNHITDLGAQYISAMLHTNRSLQSLNLSSNRIQDIGAIKIINEFCMIKLTHSEIVELRRRNLARLINHKVLVEDREKGLKTSRISDTLDGVNLNKIKSQKTKRSQISLQMKKGNRENSFLKIQELFGSDSKMPTITLPGNQELDCHPFKRESRPINGELISTGNLNLQHLNFNYNSLTNETLDKLIDCLYYQDYMILDDLFRGLLYINLEGTNIQKEDNELWLEFRELLSHRRQESKMENVDYDSRVSVESSILRNEIVKSINI